ncbi:hypothetical protein PRUPE_1G385200 [Prunus persica]|uniref:Uncharacterized protein n=1 Tax=Prunus persica TaxID=3760 RepID=A0A251R9T8_PRUPE|nr:hypothetical protein PRUPE_1G385200 [Prunus persica]
MLNVSLLPSVLPCVCSMYVALWSFHIFGLPNCIAVWFDILLMMIPYFRDLMRMENWLHLKFMTLVYCGKQILVWFLNKNMLTSYFKILSLSLSLSLSHPLNEYWVFFCGVLIDIPFKRGFNSSFLLFNFPS